MDYEKLGYTVIKMKYGDVGKYNIKNNIFITDIERKKPSFACAEDGVLFLGVWCTENISMFLKNMGKSSVKHQHLFGKT